MSWKNCFYHFHRYASPPKAARGVWIIPRGRYRPRNNYLQIPILVGYDCRNDVIVIEILPQHVRFYRVWSPVMQGNKKKRSKIFNRWCLPFRRRSNIWMYRITTGLETGKIELCDICESFHLFILCLHNK